MTAVNIPPTRSVVVTLPTMARVSVIPVIINTGLMNGVINATLRELSDCLRHLKRSARFSCRFDEPTPAGKAIIDIECCRLEETLYDQILEHLQVKGQLRWVNVKVSAHTDDNRKISLAGSAAQIKTAKPWLNSELESFTQWIAEPFYRNPCVASLNGTELTFQASHFFSYQ